MKPFSYNLSKHPPHPPQKKNINPFSLRETSGLRTAPANLYLRKKLHKEWQEVAATSYLSVVQLVALVSEGEQYRQTCISKSPVNPIIKSTAVFPRPKPSRENHSSERQVFLSKVKWPKLENWHTAVNVVQHTQPHNAFPTQRTLLNNYSLCKPASISSHST